MNKKQVTREVSRRQFLGTAAAAAAITIVPRYVLGGPKFVAPSEKVNVAIIGAGGQGRTNARNLFNEDQAQIIALADVAEETDLGRFYYGGKGGRKPVKAEVEKHYSQKTPNFQCKDYADFREMLDKEKGIDAVLCATPDHWHAYIAIMAMKMGKHVYCEKPMGHNIWEVRQMAKVAKETGVATQMGNQGHSGEGLRLTAEWLADGAIGTVKEIHVWSDTGRWVDHNGRPGGNPQVPAGFNWDLWQGPRESRPYHPEYAPYNWRGWWSFGTGAIGDMACHNMDPAVFGLNLQYPTLVESYAPTVDSEVVSLGTICHYRFGQRGNLPPVTMTWYDGGLRPQTPAGIDVEDGKQRIGDGGNGILFIGEKGYITGGGWAGMPRLLPLSLHREYKRPGQTLARSKGHHTDWLIACKGGPQSSANFEYSAKLTEIVLLGNVALRTRKPLVWDGPNMKATNAPDADKFIKETYRPEWEIKA